MIDVIAMCPYCKGYATTGGFVHESGCPMATRGVVWSTLMQTDYTDLAKMYELALRRIESLQKSLDQATEIAVMQSRNLEKAAKTIYELNNELFVLKKKLGVYESHPHCFVVDVMRMMEEKDD